jgi:hypothetical protein
MAMTHNAAARLRTPATATRATGCTGSTKNCMGVLLTSRRSSLAASRRRLEARAKGGAGGSGRTSRGRRAT